MAHHVYTTPGFIVHSKPTGEAGKFFLIFTRELGMLGATAQGVRFSQSKLRYHTQDYSYSLFSLVRGKEVWRITGVKEMEGIGEIQDQNTKLWVQILTLLKRLMPGEEQNERLFDVLENFYRYLTIERKDKDLVEYLTVLRILHILGYVDDNPVEGNEISDEILLKIGKDKENVLKVINNGLKQSQL
jgi:DNA repair protein RecO